MGHTRRATIRHLLAVGRLHFLGGGVLVYVLGAIVALYETSHLNVGPLLLGLPIVLLLQLMTHYINEYWDRDSDALVGMRTPFSGGSGMLAAGQVSASMIYNAGIACGALAILLTIVLALTAHLSGFSLLIITLTLAGGFAYSHPPLRLVARGVGEATAAVVVCFLAPLVAYSLQTATLSALFVTTCLPAMIMLLGMILSIEMPDYQADHATAKGNLVVRLGLRRAARVQNAAVAGSYLVSLVSVVPGVPLSVALLPMAGLPLAIVQMALARAVASGDVKKIPLMAFLSVALFAAFCVLQITGYVLLLLQPI